eukprot:CAMPEP_0184046540 /NCGR_PEP_ID=MMETSP0956-20121227/1626_1 /TAXON_ID=627963 /ORGANISM="Aplanochytrium sp, Strain PBS07" /LENGTH=1304 /DNA_ID=CAMNT_0026338161 /DNA_START=636 /DNA_END=4550 /DNA_ORIENTATION=-
METKDKYTTSPLGPSRGKADVYDSLENISSHKVTNGDPVEFDSRANLQPFNMDYDVDIQEREEINHSEILRERSMYDSMDSTIQTELSESHKLLEETKRENSFLLEEISKLREEFVGLETSNSSSLRKRAYKRGSKLFNVQNNTNLQTGNSAVFATGRSGKVFGKSGPGTMQNYEDNTLIAGTNESDLSSGTFSHSRAHMIMDGNKGNSSAKAVGGSYSYLFPYHRPNNQKENILVQIRHRRYSLARERKMHRNEEKGLLELDHNFDLGVGPVGKTANSGNSKKGKRTLPSKSESLRGNEKFLEDTVLVDKNRGSVIHLPRGGVYVNTKKGAVQFGIPPETIKDSLKLGLKVPTVYVVPKERFNIKLGINMCEVEFPAYFNYFLQNLSIHLVVTPEVESIVRAVVDETLEGPESEYLYVDEEYPDQTPESGRFAYAARPDHQKEINFFKEPRNGNEISTDKLVKFIYLLPKKQHQTSGEEGGTSTCKSEKCVKKVCEKCGRKRSNSNNSNKSNGSCGSCGSSHSARSSGRRRKRDSFREATGANSDSSGSRSSGNSHGRTGVEDIESEEAGVANETSHFDYPQAVEDEEIFEDPILEADLGNGLIVQDLGNEYVVLDDGHEVARVPSFLCSWAPAANPARKCIYVPKTVVDPPEFGITVLGSSHGFDKYGSTSGFVLWIHKTGIMVDPPPHATDILMRSGITPSMISGVILTHCHADHDAGTFQKILKESKITLITTKTILDSLIRKYSIISGFAPKFLLRLFEQRIVKIGEKVHWGSGTLRFFYSLHALPCIGFEAHVSGKSFVYSADTFYDPQGLQKLTQDGYLTPARYNGLMDFPFHYDICIHEAGIPPIHTPFSVLQQLPEEVRQHLYIIHISNERAKEAGLRHAQVGVENSILIPVKKSTHNAAASILKLLLASDIFRNLTMAQASDLLQLTDMAEYGEGEYICTKGDEGSDLYLILTGFVGVELGDAVMQGPDSFNKVGEGDPEELNRRIFGSGDYLGEIALLNNTSRTASILALTKVTLLKLDEHAFHYVMDMTPGLRVRLDRLSRIRHSSSWKAIDSNSVFSRLGSSQRAQLQAILHSVTVKAGDVLWKYNAPALNAYLIASGELEFAEIREELGTPFAKGAFLCNIISMLSHLAHDTGSDVDKTKKEHNSSEVFAHRSSKLSDTGRESFDFDSRLKHHTSTDSRRRTGFMESSWSNLESNTTERKRRWRGSFSVGDQNKFLPSLMSDESFTPSTDKESTISDSERSGQNLFVTSVITLVAKTDCKLFYVEPDDMIDFLEQNPGIFINLIDSLVLE